MNQNTPSPGRQRETGQSPADIYHARKSDHLVEQHRLTILNGRLGMFRSTMAVLILAGVWLSLAYAVFSFVWLLLPVTVFSALVIIHQRVRSALKKVNKAVYYYQQRLRYFAGKRPDNANSGQRYVDASHPYASDLDLFGEGSVFEQVCDATTRLGQDQVAQWLCECSDLQTIKQRQQAVEELRSQIDFREQLALIETHPQDQFDQHQLMSWLERNARPVPRWQRIVALSLGGLTVIAILLAAFDIVLWPLLVTGIGQILFYAGLFSSIKQTAAEAEQACTGLRPVSQVLNIIEQQQFCSPLLKQLLLDLQTQGLAPSENTRQLRNLVYNLNNCLSNQYIAPVAFLLGIPLQLVHKIETWRQEVGTGITLWFNAAGQIEALSSLARYGFENPGDPFPELVADDQASCFEAEALGHPLIGADNCVTNDICINTEQRLVMVSGSNMSGKSTLLRSIGTNAVLALCGAPVRAKKLTLSRFTLGTVIQVNDSLQSSESLFYSVISRIKQVVDLAGQSPPLLFLFDEILQGTNSHDRKIGAQAIIAQLLNLQAKGLVTTHDLALTAIADKPDSRAVNVHFEDRILNGKMHFDYCLRAGVVKKSNALELMRMVGLDVSHERCHESEP